MKILVVIPARLASTRLPNKPLVEICGKSMIQRTYERCFQAVDGLADLLVATDDELIFDHCKARNMNVMMTSKECLTGTDRVAEVSTKRNADYYVNVQGDEPLINPKDIQKVIKSIYSSKGDIVNGYAEIKEEREYFSFTIPKVVFREDERLLYMSRSPIPGNKKGSFEKAYRQICIYAFPKNALNDFAQRKVKTRFEETEDIEILRFLEIGHEVQMVKLSEDSIAVDTKEDLERVIAIIEKENS